MAESSVTLACTRYITAQKTHRMQQPQLLLLLLLLLLLEADTFLVAAGNETYSSAKEYN